MILYIIETQVYTGPMMYEILTLQGPKCECIWYDTSLWNKDSIL